MENETDIKLNNESIDSKSGLNQSTDNQNTVTESTGKSKKPIIITIIIIASLLLVSFAVYALMSMKYDKTYLPGTYINGIKAEGRTPESIKEEIKDLTSGYTLKISSRENDDIIIRAEDIDLKYVTDSAIDYILDSQNQLLWGLGYFKNTDYKISTMTDIDENLFDSLITSLPLFDRNKIIVSEDAYISEYISGKGRVIVPEVIGNELGDEEAVIDYIRESILTLRPEIDIDAEENDFYINPDVYSNNADLIEKQNYFNKYYSFKINYEYSDICIDADLINNWLRFGPDDHPILDKDRIAEYTKVISQRYDTVYKTHKLTTSWGPEVDVLPGNYGWQVDQVKETEQIISDILAAEDVTREPVYIKTAASHDERDYGDTYVEVNISAQHLYYYKDGKCILESDFVSGRESDPTRRTTRGTYSVFAMQTDRTLRGTKRPDGTYEYESYVNRWMPFNNGIGFHDATWRSKFGGKIYKTDGSHGCINLPLSKAKELFKNMFIGCPVLVYEMDMTGIKDPQIEIFGEDRPAETRAVKPQPQIQAETQTVTEPSEVQTEASIQQETQSSEIQQESQAESQPEPYSDIQDETQPETQPQETIDLSHVGPGFIQKYQ